MNKDKNSNRENKENVNKINLIKNNSSNSYKIDLDLINQKNLNPIQRGVIKKINLNLTETTNNNIPKEKNNINNNTGQKLKRNLPKKNITEKNDSNKNKNKNISNINKNITPNKPKEPTITITTNTMKNINEMTLYLDRENSIMLKHYGADIYHYTKELELLQVPYNFLKRHKVNPEIRTKMIDWMVEVLSVYKSETDTFFLAVNILDLFIHKSNEIVKTDDVHLIGMTSMFIASKFEDVIPIRMHQIVSRIGHNIFTEDEIRLLETKILECIQFDSLIITSVYEFVKTYFFDFLHNNRDQIRIFKIGEVIEEFEKSAIYLAKLMMHFESFYFYKCSLKAVAAVITAFDILRSSSSRLIDNEGEKFIKDWILFIIQECNFLPDSIGEVYTKLVDCYKKFEKVGYISHNLNKFNKLEFK